MCMTPIISTNLLCIIHPHINPLQCDYPLKVNPFIFLGRLTFTDDVSVIGPEGVELVVLATINSIHPSTLKTIDDQGNLQINTNVTFNTTLHVSETAPREV